MVDSNTYEDGPPGYHLRMFQEWNSILGQFEVFGGDEAVYPCWKSSHRSARNQTLRNYQVDMAAYAEYARNNDWHRVPFTKFKTWIQLMEGRLERSCTAYEKSTGKKMRIKNSFKAEERARLAELDRIKLSKALWYLLSIDEREEIGFNRHQICQLNTKEIKERIIIKVGIGVLVVHLLLVKINKHLIKIGVDLNNMEINNKVNNKLVV